ncbi:hypothetical protein AB733_11900 [Photobacterium swingsii]|uniref:Uncharacterized protein n=1 Tax=Photobacterium swingsii TaxID=680026 RepID=A0A0J8VBA1_9GAMM|nr:hypothetical protein [Photobacterium swingsii]KMV30372.1 hypothetical protein AB733_11900 [Photobacterium swingsii]PSW24459.1 hypothetical protein C9I94_10490 [Photobacterium swingsii]
MENISKKCKSVYEEASDNAAKYEYSKLKVEDLVIEHCLEKGFITPSDVTEKKRKYLLVKGFVEISLDAFRLVEDININDITQHNLNDYLEYKKKLSTRIIKGMSEKLLASLPDFR